MEDLTKHQLILLVLLVTFVTSIATGIITFTLLSEAPVAVTQNINRVVERTIEKVVPTEVGEPKTVTTTVVVSEEDRVLEAIAKNEKSIVRLKTSGADGSEIVSGLGLVVADNVIVSDARAYSKSSSYTVAFYDGKIFPVSKVFVDEANSLVFLKVDTSQNNDQKYTFHPVTFGDSDSLKIGQSIIAISGRDSNAASIGRVFQIKFAEDKKTVLNIFSDIKVSRAHFGSPILNLTGEVVGLEAPMSELDTEYSYTPVSIIKNTTTIALTELSK